MKSTLFLAVAFILCVNTYGQKLATLVVNETAFPNNSTLNIDENKRTAIAVSTAILKAD